MTGISAVEGKTLTEHIVNNGNDQIPETGQQWGFEHEINLGQIKMNHPGSGMILKQTNGAMIGGRGMRCKVDIRRVMQYLARLLQQLTGRDS
ncbi:hypothetical protein VAWG002_29050 [Aeromonas veronii]|nr:hypothetical protein VAWG002_29050 [Aeromonas veronii]